MGSEERERERERGKGRGRGSEGTGYFIENKWKLLCRFSLMLRIGK